MLFRSLRAIYDMKNHTSGVQFREGAWHVDKGEFGKTLEKDVQDQADVYNVVSVFYKAGTERDLKKTKISVSTSKGGIEATVAELFSTERSGKKVHVCGGSGSLSVAKTLAEVVYGTEASFVKPSTFGEYQFQGKLFNNITEVRKQVLDFIKESLDDKGEMLTGTLVMGGESEIYIGRLIQDFTVAKLGKSELGRDFLKEAWKIINDGRKDNSRPLSRDKYRKEDFKSEGKGMMDELDALGNRYLDKAGEGEKQGMSWIKNEIRRIEIIDKKMDQNKIDKDLAEITGIVYKDNIKEGRDTKANKDRGRYVFDKRGIAKRAANYKYAVREMIISRSEEHTSELQSH